MKNIIKCVIYYIIIINVAHSQTYFGCANESNSNSIIKTLNCSESSLDYLNQYRYKTQYIPHNLNDVIKTLHINFNIWQRADGTGNLINNPATIARLKQIAIWINNHYQYIYPQLIPVPYTVENISDSKIRVVLDSIYFYTDPSTDSAYFYSYYNYGHNILLDNYIRANFPERTKALNIHLTGAVYPGAGGYSDFGSIESFYHHNPEMDTSDMHDYWFSEHWSHEIGHAFDLWHTYDVRWLQNCDNSYFDFLWDVYDTTVNCSSSGCKVCLLPVDTTNNNLMGAGNNNHISALQMGIIHRSTVMENFYNINYGIRNHVTGYSEIPYEITKNEVWDFSMKFYQNIIVKTGYTLTIKCEVQFVPEAKIIVEPGAKLIIDGGTLTNEKYFDKLWQGIEVWGNKNHSQVPISNQGYVYINGGTIENAHNAITLWHPDDWNSMGGIVKADGATFLNNTRSVEFMMYENHLQNGTLIRNLSSFTNCTFKIDDDYKAVDKNDFGAHVTLWAVNGVSFSGCTFLNEQSNKEYSTDKNNGILSIDAGYTIGDLCTATQVGPNGCPPEHTIKSTFKGFNIGVRAMGGSTSNAVKIDKSVFDQNIKGVEFDAIDNSWVNRSKFYIGNNTISNTPTNNFYHEGIFTNTTTRFRIEEDTIYPSSNFVSNSIGVRVSSTGGNNNQIYHNLTNGLLFGEWIEGVNRDFLQPFNGLKLLCNTHDNIHNDIFVVPLLNSTNTNDGICMYQGVFAGTLGPSFSAGNLFSGLDCDYKNSTDWGIIYYHTGATEPTKPSTCGFISTTEINQANTCPSNFSNGLNTPIDAITMAQLSNEYHTKETMYLNMLYNYNNLIDGGNTNLLLNQIELSWPEDAWDLRAKLLSCSPYLSTKAIEDVAMKGRLPQAMLLEICLANPDGTRSLDFINVLKEEIPDPLPEYMTDLIIANWDAKTIRTYFEGNLANITSRMDLISSLMISDCLMDSVIQKEEMRNWLLRRGNLSDYYSLLESFIEDNIYEHASYYLEQIPILFKLSDEQYAEYENFREFLHFRKAVALSGKNIMQLDSNGIEFLQHIADNNTGRSSVLAQNILCFAYHQCVDYLAADEKNEKHLFSKPTTKVLKSENNKITATPNPANVYVTFSWEIPLLEGNTILLINDVSGKTITQKTINDKNGQWLWDTRFINDGIYYYEVKSDHQQLGKGKIIINK